MGDYMVENHGSVFLIRPRNEHARKHLKDNTGVETVWFCGALACEPRYVPELVAALTDEGFEVEA